MKKYTFMSFICSIVLLYLFAVPVHSQTKTIKMKFANIFPPPHKCSIIWGQWCKDVEKRTNGRIKIDYLPGGTLVPAAEAYEATVRGITDIAWCSQQWNAGRFPLTEVMYLPLGATTATQGCYMINEWYKKFKPKEYDDTKVLHQGNAPPGAFLTTKVINSIHDLKGMKIRAAGDTAKIAAAMGAVPVSVPVADIYEGLKRGVVDGVIFPPEALKGWRWGDVIRCLQDNSGIRYVSANCVVMNEKKWASLPSDIQAIIEELNEEYIQKAGAVWDRIQTEGIAFGISKGMKVVKISEEEAELTRQKLKPLLDDYVKRMAKLGLPGEESLKFCQDYIKNNPQ